MASRHRSREFKAPYEERGLHVRRLIDSVLQPSPVGPLSPEAREVGHDVEHVAAHLHREPLFPGFLEKSLDPVLLNGAREILADALERLDVADFHEARLLGVQRREQSEDGEQHRGLLVHRAPSSLIILSGWVLFVHATADGESRPTYKEYARTPTAF